MRIKNIPTALVIVPLLVAGVAVPAVIAQSGNRDSSQIVNGDRTIAEGETVDDIVVIGGDLTVLGEITGDAAVLGGDLILEASGVIQGDAFVTGGQLLDQGGAVYGEMRTIDGGGDGIAREILEAMDGVDERRLDDVRERREIVVESRRDRDSSGPLRRGFAGLISTIALGLVLAGIGTALVFYGRPYLETVSDTVRGAGVRSAATGIAATFLVLPAFVVLIVACAVSIVGIPLLLVLVPLYPLAVFAAAVLGLLAVTHAIGERTAEQSRQPFDMRYRNSYAYLFTGLAMLLTPLLAADLLSMTGFLGFIGTLLHVVVMVAIWAFTTVGFGAVVLSRAGTRRTFVPTPPGATFDNDDFFGEEPRSRESA